MPLSRLSILASLPRLRILFVDAGDAHSLNLACLLTPLQAVARLLPEGRLEVVVMPLTEATAMPAADIGWHIIIVVASEAYFVLPAAASRQLMQLCSTAQVSGAVGAAVLWCARAGALDGLRTAFPWALYPDADDLAERAILTPQLFEFDGKWLTCCGGAATLDFALALVEGLFGSVVQASVKETLCIDRVRGPAERQRMALQARFGALQPKLSEAVTLMEANIEEPLATDDIANLVGISRRQLERQFKQYLGSVPSRYYLELRLQRARQLLRDSSHSIVQIGLMCGFSSGSHFSTAYGGLFNLTPRDERRRKLLPGSTDDGSGERHAT